MPNMITFSYLRHDIHLLSWRDLHNTRENDYLTGAKSHPSCKINPSQGRLFSVVGFGKGIFKTKHFECFKTAGCRVKGKQQTQPRNILPVRSSLDDEFRSSRNIAIGLHKRYRNVVERGCGEKLREFIKAGVTAYAVGCTDEGLRKELISLKASDVEADGIPSSGSSTRLRAKITSEEAPCKDIAVGANGSHRSGRRASSSCWLDEIGLCNVRGGQSTMAQGVRLWLV